MMNTFMRFFHYCFLKFSMIKLPISAKYKISINNRDEILYDIHDYKSSEKFMRWNIGFACRKTDNIIKEACNWRLNTYDQGMNLVGFQLGSTRLNLVGQLENNRMVNLVENPNSKIRNFPTWFEIQTQKYHF